MGVLPCLFITLFSIKRYSIRVLSSMTTTALYIILLSSLLVAPIQLITASALIPITASVTMITQRLPIVYTFYVRPTIDSQLKDGKQVCDNKPCTVRGNAVFQDNLDGLAYSIYLGGEGIKEDHLYEFHLAEECNLSVDSVLFAKVRKYGNELEGLWVTGASSKMSCNGGEGRVRVKGRRLVVIVRDAATKGERIVGCSTKME